VRRTTPCASATGMFWSITLHLLVLTACLCRLEHCQTLLSRCHDRNSRVDQANKVFCGASRDEWTCWHQRCCVHLRIVFIWPDCSVVLIWASLPTTSGGLQIIPKREEGDALSCSHISGFRHADDDSCRDIGPRLSCEPCKMKGKEEQGPRHLEPSTSCRTRARAIHVEFPAVSSPVRISLPSLESMNAGLLVENHAPGITILIAKVCQHVAVHLGKIHSRPDERRFSLQLGRAYEKRVPLRGTSTYAYAWVAECPIRVCWTPC